MTEIVVKTQLFEQFPVTNMINKPAVESRVCGPNPCKKKYAPQYSTKKTYLALWKNMSQLFTWFPRCRKIFQIFQTTNQHQPASTSINQLFYILFLSKHLPGQWPFCTSSSILATRAKAWMCRLCRPQQEPYEFSKGNHGGWGRFQMDDTLKIGWILNLSQVLCWFVKDMSTSIC